VPTEVGVIALRGARALGALRAVDVDLRAPDAVADAFHPLVNVLADNDLLDDSGPFGHDDFLGGLLDLNDALAERGNGPHIVFAR
jgi:hypothetical protein